MMGHVLNLLTAFVRETGGDEAVEKVFALAGIEGREFRFERVYPEEDFSKLVVAALEVFEVDVPFVEEQFARYFMRVSPELFPMIFKLAGGSQELIRRIPHLHRSIPSAANRQEYRDKLTVERDEENLLGLRYESPHKLCGFLQHLVNLTLEHYSERGEIQELECMRDGAEACRIEVRFLGAA